MRNNLLVLTAPRLMLTMVFLASAMADAAALSARAAPVPAGDDACVPGVAGLIMHDDGSAEDGFGVFGSNVGDGRLVDLFTPSSYPASFSTVCFSFITLTEQTTLDFNVVVYAPDGDGGTPGTLLGSVAATATGIRAFDDGINPPRLQAFNISELGLNIASGSVYIGAQWDATGQPDFAISADETATTPPAGGYAWFNAAPWLAMGTDDLYRDYRALFVRAIEAAPGAPTPRVDKAFAPDLFQMNTPSVLTITLSFANGTTAATLTQPLTDTLPAGLVIAPNAAAATTCAGGGIAVTPGESTLEVAAGTQIPAGASCTVTVAVQAQTAGSYVNLIAAGALVTDQGVNANPAQATAMVYPAGGLFPPDEDFEETAPPNLPSGWTTQANGADQPWVTQRNVYDSLPTAAYTPDAQASGDASLTTPAVLVGAGARLSFRQKINAEENFDGGHLEIASDDGAFGEIIAAGGSFVGGGYNGTLGGDSCTPNGLQPNPLGPGPLWTSASAGFFTTTVDLPAVTAGHRVRLRWRFGTDCSFAAVDPSGWWIDTIHLDTGVAADDAIFCDGFETAGGACAANARQH